MAQQRPLENPPGGRADSLRKSARQDLAARTIGKPGYGIFDIPDGTRRKITGQCHPWAVRRSASRASTRVIISSAVK